MDRAVLPTASVVPLASEAPRVGADIGFDYGVQRFHGRVVAITSLRKAKSHVNVLIGLTDAEHWRLILGTRLPLPRQERPGSRFGPSEEAKPKYHLETAGLRGTERHPVAEPRHPDETEAEAGAPIAPHQPASVVRDHDPNRVGVE
jgi:hypothetical protein